ncbi:MAG: putative lipid II flippase FtsW [Steroidobacteraceae bacterium]
MSAQRTAMSFARSSVRGRAVFVDPVTLALVLAILLFGLIMLTSASISIAGRDTGNPFYFIERQLIAVLIGVAGGIAAFCLKCERLERLSPALLVMATLLLLAVLVPGLGERVNGGRRWLHLAGFSFQISDLARILVLIYVASYAARRQDELADSFGGLAKPLGMLALFAALMLGEPNFGGALVLFATGFGMLFLAGARPRHVAAITLLATLAFTVLAITSPYRLRRLTGFLDPWAQPYGSGFQLTQSLIAIGRGKLFGVGLGNSVQKLFYLPEAYTDFLFAVLCEELGLAGALLTIALFVALIWRSFQIAARAGRAGLVFHQLLAAGFGLWLGMQAFINIGVNMGVLPTKGLPLPMMSYGRSNMITTLVWVGIVLRIHHETLIETRGATPANSESAA